MSDRQCTLPIMVIRIRPSYERGVKGRWRSRIARTLLHITAKTSAISLVLMGKSARVSRASAVQNRIKKKPSRGRLSDVERSDEMLLSDVTDDIV